MGVWIETFATTSESMTIRVTPCMGVWIETLIRSRYVGVLTSHPVWVCGLKHAQLCENLVEERVTPCMGVWIETLMLLARAQAS